MKKHIIPISGFALAGLGLAMLALSAPSVHVPSEEAILTESEIISDRYSMAAHNSHESLPHQAWVCDIIGVGRVTNAFENTDGKRSRRDEVFVDLVADEFWRGDPGTNTFRIPMRMSAQPPVTNMPLVFFLTKYGVLCGRSKEKRGRIFVYMDMDEFRADEEANGLWFKNDVRSWFHVNDANAELVTFASNLVFSVNSNEPLRFYEIIRDGFNGHPLESRIHYDSYGALTDLPQYLRTDLLIQIWKDPALPEYVKPDIWGYMYNTHKIDLYPRPTVIMIR